MAWSELESLDSEKLADQIVLNAWFGWQDKLRICSRNAISAKNWYFDRDLEVILLIEISGSKVMTV